jgi:hypothetical protein
MVWRWEYGGAWRNVARNCTWPTESHHLVPDTDDLLLQGRDLARIVVDHEDEGIALAGLGVETAAGGLDSVDAAALGVHTSLAGAAAADLAQGSRTPNYREGLVEGLEVF